VVSTQSTTRLPDNFFFFFFSVICFVVSTVQLARCSVSTAEKTREIHTAAMTAIDKTLNIITSCVKNVYGTCAWRTLKKGAREKDTRQKSVTFVVGNDELKSMTSTD
jgi:uncharacterized membrane protein YidH (DUF202 family)